MSGFWIGADPGGKDKFGLALLGDAGEVSCWTVSSVQQAVETLKNAMRQSEPLGLGIDAPMWWSARKGGGRKADDFLRQKCSVPSGTVQSANSLRGAALVGGALLASAMRQEYPNIPITETHPKALLIAMKCGGREFLRKYGISPNWNNEHERDAAIGAVSAREGFEGRWTIDLSKRRYESEQDPQIYWLAPVAYFWPERAVADGR